MNFKWELFISLPAINTFTPALASNPFVCSYRENALSVLNLLFPETGLNFVGAFHSIKALPRHVPNVGKPANHGGKEDQHETVEESATESKYRQAKTQQILKKLVYRAQG